MSVFSRALSALRNLLRKDRGDAELDAGIRTYVEGLADEMIAAGVEPAAPEGPGRCGMRRACETGGSQRAAPAREWSFCSGMCVMACASSAGIPRLRGRRF